jgi:hypothetical protein
MSPDWRRWTALLLPPGLAVAMAIGTMLGGSIASGNRVSHGDLDIGPALVGIVTVAFAFIGASLTILIRMLMRRDASDRIALRTGLGVVAGGLIGAASESKIGGPSVFWIMLVLLPVALAAPWPFGDR